MAAKKEDTNWSDLEARFRRLQPKDEDGLRAEYCSSGFKNEPLWAESRWALRDSPSTSTEYQFKILANRGAKTAGKSGSLDSWLNLLKKADCGYRRHLWEILYEKPYGSPEERAEIVRQHYEEVYGKKITVIPQENNQNKTDSGEIPRVCEWSAIYCERQSNRATNPQKAVNPFKEIPDLKWEEVSISVISKDSIKIQARGKNKIILYSDLGLRDGRKGDLPRKAWDTFKDLATGNGKINWNSSSSDSFYSDQPDYLDYTSVPLPKLRTRIKELRKKLRNYFGIDSDPFFAYRKCHEYKTKFQIKDDTSNKR